MAEMDPRRYLCSHLVTLRSDGKSCTANLEEIQADGAVMETDFVMNPGTAVELDCGTVSLAGKITKAEEHGFGCRVTVEFSPSNTWSPELFRPEHMYDPEVLVRKAT